ncbi:MAG: rhodanese-like domain-containing protein [Proteobacteria bacterium]|nr:rhodanese-like domain-containing protein [Pseudomonadota bacterium]
MIGGILGRLFGGGGHATFEDVQQASATGAVHVVDVREPGEFASGHVPGAINLPLSRFDAAALPTDRPVILMCQAGGRSARALGACAGRDDIRHYPGGMSGWRASGGAVSSH